MLDPKTCAKMDQDREVLGELLPPLWRKLFTGCRREGFSKRESLTLVQTFIMTMAHGHEKEIT